MSYSTFVFLIFAFEYLLYVALRGELSAYAAVFGLGAQQQGLQQTALGLGSTLGLGAIGSALGGSAGAVTGGGGGIASAAAASTAPFPGY